MSRLHALSRGAFPRFEVRGGLGRTEEVGGVGRGVAKSGRSLPFSASRSSAPSSPFFPTLLFQTLANREASVPFPTSISYLNPCLESTKRVLMHSFTIDRRCHEWPCWNPSPSNRRLEKGEGRADMGHPLTKSEAWGGELRRGRRPGGEKAKRGYSHESEPGLPVPLRRKQKNERRRRHRPYTRAPRSPHARARYRPLTRSSPGFRACPE